MPSSRLSSFDRWRLGVLVYKAGFSSEDRIYQLLDEEGQVLGEFGYKKEVDEFIDTFLDEGVEYTINKTCTPQPIEAALANTKRLITTILENVGAHEFTIFITGEGNFREDLATILPYKGNRTAAKPYHYESIRTYLMQRWSAEVIPYEEADDAMGIRQYQQYSNIKYLEEHPEVCYGEIPDHTIICTIDKDLDMIPGWHYNLDKQVIYWMNEEDAKRKFYEQLITGDKVDNIQGIPGGGPALAKKVLRDCTTEEDMCRAVMHQYKKKGLMYWDFWENAQLLWIRRDPKQQYWEPPCEWEDEDRVPSGVKAAIG